MTSWTDVTARTKQGWTCATVSLLACGYKVRRDNRLMMVQLVGKNWQGFIGYAAVPAHK